MRLATLLVCPHALALLLATSSWAAPSDSMPLKIVAKPADGPAREWQDPTLNTYKLSLLNDSPETITAWRLTCLYAEGDGNFTTTSLEHDAFMLYEGGHSSSQAVDGLVPPGAIFDVDVPRDVMNHPYQAVSCNVEAVVFADAAAIGRA